MASVVRNALQAIKEKELGDVCRWATFCKTKIHNIGAKVVGVDQFGNKYYENMDLQYGRHRWVEYARKNRYNASQAPPE